MTYNTLEMKDEHKQNTMDVLRKTFEEKGIDGVLSDSIFLAEVSANQGQDIGVRKGFYYGYKLGKRDGQKQALIYVGVGVVVAGAVGAVLYIRSKRRAKNEQREG